MKITHRLQECVVPFARMRKSRAIPALEQEPAAILRCDRTVYIRLTIAKGAGIPRDREASLGPKELECLLLNPGAFLRKKSVAERSRRWYTKF